MNALEYPVAHFNMMADLATRLASKSIQLLEHRYDYEAFGSWFFVCRSSGNQFRVVFDGKEYMLLIEKSAEKRWEEVASQPARTSEPAEIAAYIMETLNRA